MSDYDQLDERRTAASPDARVTVRKWSPCAAESVRRLADYLEENPDALLKGRRKAN